MEDIAKPIDTELIQNPIEFETSGVEELSAIQPVGDDPGDDALIQLQEQQDEEGEPQISSDDAEQEITETAEALSELPGESSDYQQDNHEQQFEDEDAQASRKSEFIDEQRKFQQQLPEDQYQTGSAPLRSDDDLISVDESTDSPLPSFTNGQKLTISAGVPQFSPLGTISHSTSLYLFAQRHFPPVVSIIHTATLPALTQQPTKQFLHLEDFESASLEEIAASVLGNGTVAFNDRGGILSLGLSSFSDFGINSETDSLFQELKELKHRRAERAKEKRRIAEAKEEEIRKKMEEEKKVAEREKEQKGKGKAADETGPYPVRPSKLRQPSQLPRMKQGSDQSVSSSATSSHRPHPLPKVRVASLSSETTERGRGDAPTLSARAMKSLSPEQSHSKHTEHLGFHSSRAHGPASLSSSEASGKADGSKAPPLAPLKGVPPTLGRGGKRVEVVGGSQVLSSYPSSYRDRHGPNSSQLPPSSTSAQYSSFSTDSYGEKPKRVHSPSFHQHKTPPPSSSSKPAISSYGAQARRKKL